MCKIIYLLVQIKRKDTTVLLDLPAAFDTADHMIFLHHFKNINIKGLVPDWFTSYCSGHTEALPTLNSRCNQIQIANVE